MEVEVNLSPGTRPRHRVLQQQEQQSRDAQLRAVLDVMRERGFSDLLEFLLSFLTTKDKALNAQAAIFARDSFLPLLKVLIPRSRFAPCRRNTKSKTHTMSEELGSVLVPWASRFLAQEMLRLAGDSRARLPPSEVCLLRAETLI